MIYGIPHDYWHFIIPAFTLLTLIPIVFSNAKVKCAMVVTLVAVLTLALLQFWNEWNQIPSYALYGGIENFIHNSKIDTKYFMFGTFSGLFSGFLTYTLVERIRKWKH